MPDADERDLAPFLNALRRIAVATGDRAWLLQQSAEDLARISSLLFDQVMALLPLVGVNLTPPPTIRPPTADERARIVELARRLDLDAPPVASRNGGD